MKRMIVGVAALAASLGACSSPAMAGGDPCRDLAPKASVVRVHLRCESVPVHSGQRFDIVVGFRDAPLRWRQAWGGDGSLRWADRQLDDAGCGRHVWFYGTYVVGINCDF
jgi:hypothetical protein